MENNDHPYFLLSHFESLSHELYLVSSQSFTLSVMKQLFLLLDMSRLCEFNNTPQCKEFFNVFHPNSLYNRIVIGSKYGRPPIAPQ